MLDSNPYASPYTVASQPVDVRAAFIRKTYGHLAGAIMAFAIIEYLFLNMPVMQNLGLAMMNSWWIVLIAFMGVSYIAQKWAMSGTSKGMQYAGLSLYVVAEAVIFVPIMLMATLYYDGIIMQAGIITLALFAGITAIAFITKKDFSFLNSFLMIGGFVALGLIFASMIFGFQLGIIFCGAMALFAGVAILRDTSNIIHHYKEDQYVAASLGLFASVALLFWYILQILMSLTGRD